MIDFVQELIDLQREVHAERAGVIPWSSPVPVFGRLRMAEVATLGLNPSNREFVDSLGQELAEDQRRFHTLTSLGLDSWREAQSFHCARLWALCRDYFQGNPYHGWFGQLDYLIADTGSSYYSTDRPACHLDLVPFATAQKWSALAPTQRETLLRIGATALGTLLRRSPIGLVILNGRSVVERFQAIGEVELFREEQASWTLPRRNGGVVGYSYCGHVRRFGGVELGRTVKVIGYNHNIQSSFGVTLTVRREIRQWIGRVATEEASTRSSTRTGTR